MFESELSLGARAMGVEISPFAVAACASFNEKLLLSNKYMNLTGDLTGSVQRHFLDSLAILKFIDFTPDMRIADAGCGAGFPGVPLLFARPKCSFTLIDSLKKRIDFLQNALDVDNVILLNARCEDAGRDENYRESFDIVLSRAVAPLNVLAELCLPLVKPGGKFCAYKGPGALKELTQAVVAIERLGGEYMLTYEVKIPGTDWDHRIAVFAKTSGTPPQFPRKSGIPAKKPLI